MESLAPTSGGAPSAHEYLPLLRSLVDHAASLAINMALLTELFAAPPPRFCCMKGAYKVQALCQRTPKGREYQEAPCRGGAL